jgi:hypothetical protein
MELVRQVTAQDPRQRELGADRVPDWLGSYSRNDATVLAGLLSLSAACEVDHAALEAQLHALLELGSRGFTDQENISRIRDIDHDQLSENLLEYVNDLLESS